MLREFFFAGSRLDIIFAWAGIVVIIGQSVFSAYIKFAINGWYTSFYDLLQTSGAMLCSNVTALVDEAEEAKLTESRQKVWLGLVEFLRIVGPYAIFSPAARWLRSHWALRWRMCLMRSYMAGWDPNVAPVEGASQRLHEDTRMFSKGIETYLSVFLNSFCTLFAFTPILMDLGTKIAPPAWPSFAWLHAFGHGWMFASAALAAAVGLGVAMLAGSKLVGLEVANQRVEAELRRDLVILEACSERITLGTLVQTSNSFDKVFASLSVISENWGGINEWRSTLVRLRQLEGGARLERCRPHTPTLAHPHSRQFEEGQRLSATASSSRAAVSSGSGTPISDGQEAGEGMPMLPFGSSLASDRG
ncbi:hypothetical protein EMIHUDRAFT_447710 [Emiliania huxleyi CCMP1516]|uniref:ABC transmembrane type-1 domain-containing protein n=2 Tax=Emiliania huxleyi TaxID=2903 RepID=A0A0D3JH95_EMIH1|nr:hypothetical protein EMIHUDRAFT_447710 [Emiliania huxleyi CCMP1516]EOD22880.1 hypothetical protein EMIHUDRAFT_447710 [Emiliania huxleyi CCMP1516]|eukprot:XP_005775309.1 hypothetical protein EMIHUDRAFT_447710 [Emiliania huxleyi CCMP1516]